MSVEEQNVIREKLAGVGIILSEAESTSEIDCGIGKISFLCRGSSNNAVFRRKYTLRGNETKCATLFYKITACYFISSLLKKGQA